MLVNGQGRNKREAERLALGGAPRDGPCQPPDGGTEQQLHSSFPISSDPGPGVT